MALTDDEISLWELAHRLNGLDPSRRHWFGMPLALKDTFRLLLTEILNMRLNSGLIMDKREYDDDPSDPEHYIRYHLDAIYACMAGQRYPVNLFKFVPIDRYDFWRWCKHSGYPIPDFWFGLNWTYPDDLDQADNDKKPVSDTEHPAQSSATDQIAGEPQGDDEIAPEDKAFVASLVKGDFRHRNQKIDKWICQAVARTLWDEQPGMTIEDITKHKAIQIYGNGRAWSGKDTLRNWVKVVDTRSPEDKTGRPKTK